MYPLLCGNLTYCIFLLIGLRYMLFKIICLAYCYIKFLLFEKNVLKLLYGIVTNLLNFMEIFCGKTEILEQDSGPL